MGTVKIIKKLKKDFEKMVVLFDAPKWQLYKFGKGGPWKNVLPKLQTKAVKYDKKLFRHFHECNEKEIASYNKLIVLALHLGSILTPQEGYKNIDTFKRQLKWMGSYRVQGGKITPRDLDSKPVLIEKGYTFAEQQVIDQYGIEMLEALNKSGFHGKK